ncbi:MAG: hypothetical protein EOP09_19770 [Proteobacteria bacterium]|nr:MAG: hypothetical protein EOP09_19770 [Pseudomonadota bacterium]
MKTNKLLAKAVKMLDTAFKAEFRQQGHSLTGATENSILGQVDGTHAEGTMLDSGYIVNDGTTSKKIPFSGTHGKGGTSKYIQGLINFFMLRGLSEKEATGAAFATAKVQQKEGMSTAASSRFSKNGKRQNFVENVIETKEPVLDAMITAGMDDIFESEYNKQKSETI